MERFSEHDSVVYTDENGNAIDTFVIYETCEETGLTHINHKDLLVPVNQLKLHPKTLQLNHMPVCDAFSFELLKKLKEKYTDNTTEAHSAVINKQPVLVYSQAS